jgi:hypothetical protein
MRLSEKKVTATLKRNGYKLTPQRRAVIGANCGEVIDFKGKFASPQDITYNNQ